MQAKRKKISVQKRKEDIDKIELPPYKIKVRKTKNLFDKYRNVDGKDTVIMSRHKLDNQNNQSCGFTSDENGSMSRNKSIKRGNSHNMSSQKSSKINVQDESEIMPNIRIKRGGSGYMRKEDTNKPFKD